MNIWRTENVRFFFSESVIRNHRGPVWRATTTPLSFLYYFSTSNTIHDFFFYISLTLSLMQGLQTNYALPMNELIMDDCHTVQYRGVVIIFMEHFNSKSPPLTTDSMFSIEN